MSALFYVIAALIAGWTVYCIIVWVRRARRGRCCGGCANCAGCALKNDDDKRRQSVKKKS